MPKKLRNIHKQVATPVADRARALAPKLTGRLSRSIRPLGSQKVARVAAGGVAVPYAGPIHYGWPARNILAQPFLTDAVYQMLPASILTYKMMLESEMRQGWESIP